MEEAWALRKTGMEMTKLFTQMAARFILRPKR